ncbi:hypothetical protein KEM56_006732 [Ascosphaera pollenicola]|nr:hypothetical protein KEM56_006732 [Ascosphaera pollenicola]
MRFLQGAYVMALAASFLGCGTGAGAMSLDHLRDNAKRALTLDDLDNFLHKAHGEDPNKIAEQEKEKAEAAKNETVKTPPSRVHLTECHLKKDDPGAPFCLPTQNMTWRVGEVYDVTWDVDLLPQNSTVEIHVDFTETPDDGGVTAFTTEKTESSYGFVKIKTDKKWLQGKKGGNDLILTMVANSPKAGKRAKTFPGPQISLKKKPKKKKSPHRSTPPSQHDLLVGLPLTMAVLIAILIVLFYGMKKHREFNMGYLTKRSKDRRRNKAAKKKSSLRMDSWVDEALLKYDGNAPVEGLSTGTPSAQRERSRSRDERSTGAFAKNTPMKTWTE